MRRGKYWNVPSDLYKYYVKEYGNPYKVDNKQFQAIVRAFNKRIISRILLQGFSFNIPARLGSIYLAKAKHDVILDSEGEIKRFIFYAPDWAKTKELWKKDPAAKERKEIIRHTNNHTDGYTVTLVWDRQTCMRTNMYKYKIALLKVVKPTISNWILIHGVSRFKLATKSKKVYEHK